MNFAKTKTARVHPECKKINMKTGRVAQQNYCDHADLYQLPIETERH